jgi:hypothetical protein
LSRSGVADLAGPDATGPAAKPVPSFSDGEAALAGLVVPAGPAGRGEAAAGLPQTLQ